MKKLVEKSFFAKLSLWFLKNKRTIFIILGILFWGVAALGVYDNIVGWWSWGNLFISLIMFVFGFLFLPFSFPWQKKVFGASFNTVSLFTIFIFLVFTGLTFNIFQEIFQGDFIFTIWSILSVILILFWWAILIPKSSLLLTKYLGIKFTILRAQLIFIVFVIGFSVDIIGISHSSSTIDYNGVGSTCLGSELKLHSDNRIDAYITTSDNDDGNKLDQNIFSSDELRQLYYYIGGQSDEKQYYFNREICNLDIKDSTMSIMSDGGMLVEEIYPGAEGGISSNISSFNNLDFVAGNYALNIFVSDDDQNWDLVKVLKFEVK